MMTTINPPLTLAEMKRQRDELDRQINAAEAEHQREERLRKARPAAAVLLGRLLLDAQPQPRDVRRLREAATAARQADADAWEVLADHFKFKLPKAVTAVNAITQPLKRTRKFKAAAPMEQVGSSVPSDVGPHAVMPSAGTLL